MPANQAAFSASPPLPRHFGAVPLSRGATLMLVEDSLHACEVLRLYCAKLGLRLRRAADLRTARAHLRLYRPDLALIDLNLPDGRGEGLIADLNAAPQRPNMIIAMSGDGAARSAALGAGADVFWEKPLPDLADFRAAVATGTGGAIPLAPLMGAGVAARVEAQALRDDLALAAAKLRQGGADLPFVAGFVGGIAGNAHDDDLRAAAQRASMTDETAGGFRALRDLVNQRLRDLGNAPL